MQAVELRAKLAADTYDAREVLSPGTSPLYEAARVAAGAAPNRSRPLHWNDLDEFIQPKVEGLLAAIAGEARILATLSGLAESLRAR